MKLIAKVNLASTQSSIDFTSIPAIYTDLVVISSTRTGQAVIMASFGTWGTVGNGISLGGNGSLAFGQTQTGFVNAGLVNGASATASTFAASTTYIPNYRSTTRKTLLSEGCPETNANAVDQVMSVGTTTDTSAISSLSFSSSGGALFQIGTTVALYGITAGSSGGVTVS